LKALYLQLKLFAFFACNPQYLRKRFLKSCFNFTMLFARLTMFFTEKNAPYR